MFWWLGAFAALEAPPYSTGFTITQHFYLLLIYWANKKGHGINSVQCRISHWKAIVNIFTTNVSRVHTTFSYLPVKKHVPAQPHSDSFNHISNFFQTWKKVFSASYTLCNPFCKKNNYTEEVKESCFFYFLFSWYFVYILPLCKGILKGFNVWTPAVASIQECLWHIQYEKKILNPFLLGGFKVLTFSNAYVNRFPVMDIQCLIQY